MSEALFASRSPSYSASRRLPGKVGLSAHQRNERHGGVCPVNAPLITFSRKAHESAGPPSPVLVARSTRVPKAVPHWQEERPRRCPVDAPLGHAEIPRARDGSLER